MRAAFVAESDLESDSAGYHEPPVVREQKQETFTNLHGIQKRFQGQIWRRAVKVDYHHALSGIDQHR
jgi:hypothetical protein